MNKEISFETLQELQGIMKRLEEIREEADALSIGMYISVGDFMSARFGFKDLTQVKLSKENIDGSFSVSIESEGDRYAI